jgi:hypothetical protein
MKLLIVISNIPAPMHNPCDDGPSDRVPIPRAGEGQLPNSLGAQHKYHLLVPIRFQPKHGLLTGAQALQLPVRGDKDVLLLLFVHYYLQLKTALPLPT